VAPRAPRRADPRRHIFTQPWPAGPNGGRRDQVIYYQYRHDRARRILRGIEKTFRMAKSDLQARPIYHRKRDPIEAHLTIVLAALAVSRWIEARTASAPPTRYAAGDEPPNDSRGRGAWTGNTSLTKSANV
jgi:hypothetical protein